MIDKSVVKASKAIAVGLATMLLALTGCYAIGSIWIQLFLPCRDTFLDRLGLGIVVMIAISAWLLLSWAIGTAVLEEEP